MAGGGYGAVDDVLVVARDGWPSWEHDEPSTTLSGSFSSSDGTTVGGAEHGRRARRLFGSRQGVLLSCGLQEMQRALAFSAVVSTLPAALFAGTRAGAHSHTDPSRPWLETCGHVGGSRGTRGGDDFGDGCLYSPTRVVIVQMLSLLGRVVRAEKLKPAVALLTMRHVKTY